MHSRLCLAMVRMEHLPPRTNSRTSIFALCIQCTSLLLHQNHNTHNSQTMVGSSFHSERTTQQKVLWKPFSTKWPQQDCIRLEATYSLLLPGSEASYSTKHLIQWYIVVYVVIWGHKRSGTLSFCFMVQEVVPHSLYLLERALLYRCIFNAVQQQHMHETNVSMSALNKTLTTRFSWRAALSHGTHRKAWHRPAVHCARTAVESLPLPPEQPEVLTLAPNLPSVGTLALQKIQN